MNKPLNKDRDAILSEAIAQLRGTAELLEFLRYHSTPPARVPEYAYPIIIDDTTRLAIQRLNVVRSEWRMPMSHQPGYFPPVLQPTASPQSDDFVVNTDDDDTAETSETPHA